MTILLEVHRVYETPTFGFVAGMIEDRTTVGSKSSCEIHTFTGIWELRTVRWLWVHLHESGSRPQSAPPERDAIAVRIGDRFERVNTLRNLMQSNDIAIPILPSRSLPETLTFYRRLGFEGEIVGDGDGYAILTRGDLEIHFFLHAERVPADSWAGCYLRVAHVDPLYAAFSSAGLPPQGIPRMDGIENKPWGLREFAIVDEDGNLLRVGQLL